MASGITLEMKAIKRDYPIKPRETRERDRTLAGKKRRKKRN